MASSSLIAVGGQGNFLSFLLAAFCLGSKSFRWWPNGADSDRTTTKTTTTGALFYWTRGIAAAFRVAVRGSERGVSRRLRLRRRRPVGFRCCWTGELALLPRWFRVHDTFPDFGVLLSSHMGLNRPIARVDCDREGPCFALLGDSGLTTLQHFKGTGV